LILIDKGKKKPVWSQLFEKGVKKPDWTGPEGTTKELWPKTAHLAVSLMSHSFMHLLDRKDQHWMPVSIEPLCLIDLNILKGKYYFANMK
jgi:hypothetical protein